MVEVNGRAAAEQVLSPEKQRKLAIAVGGTILAIAILLAILIAMRTPQYEAQARVAYTAPGAGTVPGASLPSGNGAATALASSVFNDEQLTQLIDRYDLYPDLRQHRPTAALVGRMRSNLTLTEPETGTVQVAFRDTDQARTRAVTNGLAQALTQFEVMTNVTVAVPARETRSRKASHHRPVPSAVVSGQAPEIGELTHQVDRVDDVLQDLAAAKTELQTEQHQVETKIAALEKSERKGAANRAGAAAEGARDEHVIMEQQLNADKVKLAGLRDRYTEEYPDVQTTEAEIAALQARLAAAPSAASSGAAPTAEQSAAMEQLKEERQRVERDLGRNEASVNAETARREGLLEAIQIARMRPAKTVSSASDLSDSAKPPPAVAGTPAEAAPAGDVIAVPVFPFKVVESAGDAALVSTSRLALSLWLVLGTAVLLTLCFVPMVPAHYAAVVTTPDDLKQALPEHVTYLGDVGRTEP